MSRYIPTGKFPTKRPGFTLAETIIAMGIATFLVTVILSLQTTVVATQFRRLMNIKLSTDAMYAQELIKRDLKGATALMSPARNAPAQVLSGYVNANPLDLARPLVASKPVAYFIYCVASGASTTLYRYSGPIPAPQSFVAFNCGGASPGRQAIVSVPPGAALIYNFSVPENAANVVNAAYSMISGKETMEGKFSVQIQGKL